MAACAACLPAAMFARIAWANLHLASQNSLQRIYENLSSNCIHEALVGALLAVALEGMTVKQ